MNEMIKFNSATMSSREVAETANKRHADVLRDIKVLIEQDAITERNFALSAYTDSSGKKNPVYLLDFQATMILVTGYDAKRRAAVISRWRDLEMGLATPAFAVPKNYVDALRLAADQQEELEKQQLLIEEQTPKADFYDTVTGSHDVVDMGEVAKIINRPNLGRNNMFALLRDLKILMKNNQPYQQYCDRGYFRVIESKYNKPDGSVSISLKTVVFQKGLDFIRKLVEENCDELQTELLD